VATCPVAPSGVKDVGKANEFAAEGGPDAEELEAAFGMVRERLEVGGPVTQRHRPLRRLTGAARRPADGQALPRRGCRRPSDGLREAQRTMVVEAKRVCSLRVGSTGSPAGQGARRGLFSHSFWQRDSPR